MMMVFPRANDSAAPDALSSAEAVAKMMQYNTALQKAGVMLALDGLLPPSTGARISYTGGKATVIHGPYEDTRDVVDRYWIIQARSREEAIEWARRAPMPDNAIMEVRQLQDAPDSPTDVQHAA
ncbi:MAG TPA: YciI family protein [Gemmatimonadaceae bacterium]|jgi:hypothetical protein